MQMVVLPYLSAIRFSGSDAGEFLHNQLSADVLGLQNGKSTFACYCEPKGRVLALMLVCSVDDDYYVIMSGPLSQSLTRRLKMYVMRSKVSIDILEEHTVSGLKKGEAPELATTSILAIPVPGSDKWFAITTHDTSPDFKESTRDAWKASELKTGICWLSTESSGQFLPQMLGFDELGAVNFRKGCYPGQEIVARTHYLGKVKRHPRLLHTGMDACPKLLDKMQILSMDQSFEAVIADCGSDQESGTYIFVVTRMDPDLGAGQIEYQGKLSRVF